MGFVDMLEDIGFTVLSAESPKDIDNWPSFDSLFRKEKMYNIYRDKNNELVISSLSFDATVEIILIANPHRDEDFIREYLYKIGEFYFDNLKEGFYAKVQSL